MRYLLFLIRSVFYFFIFLRNFFHQSEWKWSICSDSHHTPHTVYAIDFLIRLSMNDDWLELIDSVNEQSRYLLFFMRFFDFFYLSFFYNLSFYLSFFSKSKFFNWKKCYEWMINGVFTLIVIIRLTLSMQSIFWFDYQWMIIDWNHSIL